MDDKKTLNSGLTLTALQATDVYQYEPLPEDEDFAPLASHTDNFKPHTSSHETPRFITATHDKLNNDTSFKNDFSQKSASPEPDFYLDILETDGSGSGDIQQNLTSAHVVTGMDKVKADYGFYGAGQTVAILDAGIEYDHYALGGGLGEGHRVVGGWDFTEENDADPHEDTGTHGTHVAGIIGSSDPTNQGVAPEVDMVALRIYNDKGMGSYTWMENALKWVIQNADSFENKITTVNISSGDGTNRYQAPLWGGVEDEFKILEEMGIFIAVAAGNSYTSYNTPGLSYPAASPYVVPVMSIDDNGNLATYSQRIASRAIGAPGNNITSTVTDTSGKGNKNGIADDFGVMSGTSMASPYIAGASVIIREAMEFVGMKNINQDMIFAHMMTTAKSIGGTAYKSIDLAAAIDALMPGDDYGSIITDAHNLGTLSADKSISGVISKINDLDFFTFTAGSTGTLKITADVTHNLVTTWQGVGVASGVANNVYTMDVVQGQKYTVGLGTSKGIGYYDLDIDINASSTPENTAPTLSTNNVSLESGKSVLASSLVSAKDAEGNTLTFTVKDTSNVSTSGYFELNGTKLVSGINHTLSAADFAKLKIVGGSEDGAENLIISVSDGKLSSGDKTIVLTSDKSNIAPVVSTQNGVLANGQAIKASSLISASDTDGDALVYTIKDNTTAANSAKLVLNGTTLSAGTNHVLSAADFAKLEIVGGTAKGTDNFTISVSDTKTPSDTKTFSIITTNTAPTISATNTTLTAGNTILASKLISASDVDGDNLNYTIKDNNTLADSAQLVLNGKTLAAGMSHTMNATDFAKLQIVGGTAKGSDNFTVSVFDGAVSSEAKTFTVSAVNNPPTLTTTEGTLAVGSKILASSLVTATDIDGDNITYTIRDNTTLTNSAKLVLNGATLYAGANYKLSAADFAKVEIVGGTAKGIDNFSIFVSDGTTSSDTKVFTVTTGNTAPVLNVTNSTLTNGTAVLASKLITASDVDGDNLTYTIKDTNTATNSAKLVLNGTTLAAGVNHTLSAADFAKLQVIGGTVKGTDNFTVSVSDGTASSGAKSFSVSTGNSAPTLNTTGITLAAEKTVLASQLITASDIDGDNLTYTIKDTNTATNSAKLVLNGTTLAAGVDHTLSAADFAKLQVVGGTVKGTNDITVSVSDGSVSSGAKSFTVTTGNTAPVLNVTNSTLTNGTAVLASKLITASDVDGDNLTYTIKDTNTATNSAKLVLNGTTLAAGVDHTLSAADFAKLQIVAGTAKGANDVTVSVSDGTLSSEVKTVNVYTANSAPEIKTLNGSIEAGKAVLASKFISVTDIDGDALTYTVRSFGTSNNNAHLVYDGVTLVSGINHTLTAEQFAKLQIVGGDTSGKDNISFTVTDGTIFLSGGINVTTTNEAPDLTAVDSHALTSDNPILLSSLVETKDKEGQALTFTIEDQNSAANSATLRLDGKILTGAQTLTEAEFSRVTLTKGSAATTDKILVSVSDGEHKVEETIDIVSKATVTSHLFMYGTGGHDTITGDDWTNIIYGYAGSDLLYGKGGNDYLIGGADNDTLDGGEGNDTLYGESGFDTLIGGLGDDILIGGEGTDILYGGAGADRFIFDSSAFKNRDIIKDFELGKDVLDISDILETSGTSLSDISIISINAPSQQTSYLVTSKQGQGSATQYLIGAIMEGVSFSNPSKIGTGFSMDIVDAKTLVDSGHMLI